ncbi:aldo/keto reductase [Sphingomonas sp. AR_OL41]|uniref:aldo/keto reductase n=1 Tax=Sphingomonas sp. AR_OL41 TaxID=3042729 RepID=UPI0024802038|nr:aldo/keto reductase [Sphingomonas sp. AR_OL41]MDH7971919.1 aldo/keto reductase [Sphingomonas sp. AR_OL41]
MAVGPSVPAMPELGPITLGTAAFGSPAHAAWNIDENAACRLVSRAVDLGITSFDTGSSYGAGLAEQYLGSALARLGRRHEITVATKIFFPSNPGAGDGGLSRRNLIATLDRSLARLRTDYVDLLMIHRFDPLVPIDETLRTLDALVRSGRVRFLGASSMSAWRLMKMLAHQRGHALAPFVAMQGHYNLLYREEEREMLPLTVEEGLIYAAWSPLARGRLAGAAGDRARLAEDRRAVERFDATLDTPVLGALDALSTQTGFPHAQLALAWLIRQGVVAVLGASCPEELSVALAARETAMAIDFGAVEAAYRPHGVIGFDPKDETFGA